MLKRKEGIKRKQLIRDAPGRMTARMDMDSKQQENAEAGSTYGVSTVNERLARHLALACPDEADDGAEGLTAWHGQVEHAATILALMKEPDEAMARDGDGAIWSRMVDADLRPRWYLDAALHGPAEAPPGGTDEEGDMPINAGDMQKKDPASWLDRKSTRLNSSH